MAKKDTTDPRIKGVEPLKGLNYLGYYGYNIPSAINMQKESNIYGNLSGVGVNYTQDFGHSIYDSNVASFYDLENLNEVRAEYQPGIAKIGAGLGKAVTTAGTTFLDGTLGLLLGATAAIDSAINEDKPWYQDISKLWDTKFSNTLREFSDAMETILPNYQSKEEQEKAWYENFGTANFWADFIKQIGFTVGAYYSGAAWTKGLGAIKKGLTGMTLGSQTAQLLGATLSAVNEGRIEANHNSHDWANTEREKAISGIADNLVQQGYSQEDAYSSAKSFLESDDPTAQAINADIEDRKAKMGLVDLAVNVPILMYDNMMTFGKLYGRGFASAQTASRSPIDGNWWTRFKKGVSEAAAKDAKEEAGKQIAKSGSKYIWNDITAGDALKRGLRTSAREGFEEMNQMWAAEGTGAAYQLDSPDAYYRALNDPKALQETKGFLTGITEGFANSYGDINKYQDFVMGALTGLLGTPTFGKGQNRSDKTYLGRGKFVGLSGGIAGAFTSSSRENTKGREAVQEMNAYVEKYGEPYTTRARHFAASNTFTDAMNGAAADGNSFDYHNAADSEEFNAIARFASVGKLDDYKQLVNQDFENLSDEDLDKIAQETINTQTGKPLWANADGSLMSSTDEGRKRMRKELSEKRDNILDGIDSYQKHLAQMRTISRIEDNEDAVQELAWLSWKIDRFNNRKERLTEESRDLLTKVLGSLARKDANYDEALRNLEPKVTTASKDPKAIKAAKETEKDVAAIKSNQNRNSQLSKSIKRMLEGKSSNLTRRGMELLLSEDFFDDLITSEGMSYNEYQATMQNIVDLDKLNNIAKQFNDRLKYYLDDSIPAKKPKKKGSTSTTIGTPTPTSSTSASTSTPTTPSAVTSSPSASTAVAPATSAATVPSGASLGGFSTSSTAATIPSETPVQSTASISTTPAATVPITTAAATPASSTLVEEKLAIEHSAIDDENAENASLTNASDLKNKVSSLAKASEVQDFVTSNEGVDIEGIINDLRTENPNHPAVQAHDINKVLDKVFPSIQALNGTFPLGAVQILWNTISDMADTSASPEEFQNTVQSSIPALAQALSINPSAPAADTLINTLEQTLRDSFNKIKEDNNTSESLAAESIPSEATVPSTGADDTSSSSYEAPTPIESNEDLQDAITKAKNKGLGDSQTVDHLLSLGYEKEAIDKQLTLWKSNAAAYNPTEEEAAIKPEYENDQVATTTSSSAVNVQTGNSEILDNSTKYNFLSPLTTQHPRWQQREERTETFNYDSWVDAQSWSPEVKLTTKVRHARIESSGGYARVDNGEIQKGQKAGFRVIKADNDAAHDFIVYITSGTEADSPIIGDLGSRLNPEVNKFIGQSELLDSIEKQYKEAGEPDTFMPKESSTVDKVMAGRPQFVNTVSSLTTINPNLPIAIVTDANNRTLVTANKDRVPVVDTSEIAPPINPKAGQVYVLVPNGRKGGRQGYTAVLATTPRFDNSVTNTPIYNRIVESLRAVESATSYSQLVDAIKDLKELLWIPDIHINAYNSKGLMHQYNASGPITRITIKRAVPSGTTTQYQDIIAGGIIPGSHNVVASLMNALKGTPIHINTKFINTEEGRELYNSIVQTNLPAGTETTVNNWFTINPVVAGKENKATSPRSTGVNPNTRTTNQTFNIGNGQTLELDANNEKVYINGIEHNPIPTTDPKHLNSIVNRALAKAYKDKHPEAITRNGAIHTPYGWYDESNKKLVLEPNDAEIVSSNSSVPTFYTKEDSMESHMGLESTASGTGSAAFGNKSITKDSRVLAPELRTTPGVKVVNQGDRTAIVWSTQSSIRNRNGLLGVYFDKKLNSDEISAVESLLQKWVGASGNHSKEADRKILDSLPKEVEEFIRNNFAYMNNLDGVNENLAGLLGQEGKKFFNNKEELDIYKEAVKRYYSPSGDAVYNNSSTTNMPTSANEVMSQIWNAITSVSTQSDVEETTPSTIEVTRTNDTTGKTYKGTYTISKGSDGSTTITHSGDAVYRQVSSEEAKALGITYDDLRLSFRKQEESITDLTQEIESKKSRLENAKLQLEAYTATKNESKAKEYAEKVAQLETEIGGLERGLQWKRNKLEDARTNTDSNLGFNIQGIKIDSEGNVTIETDGNNLIGEKAKAVVDKVFPELAQLSTQESVENTSSTTRNPNILGEATINGKTEEILLDELLDAQLDGYGASLTPLSDINQIAQAIEEWRNNERPYERKVNDTLTYTKFNREKELAWLKRVLPNIADEDRVQLVEGLIRNKAWGMFSKGIMYLSDQAAEGTTYHEAFHAVSQTLLNDKERDRLYKAAKERYGDKSIYDLEEDLAEDFRKYTQRNEIPQAGVIRRMFRKLKNWIDNLRGKQMDLDRLFYDINQGIYASRIQRVKEGTAYMQATINQEELDNIKTNAIADGTFMKAPNGKPTNLNERQWLQVRTKAFKNWFGDWENDSANSSKVVDENGEPLVVYHNTPFDFDGIFDMDHPSRIMPWTSEPFGHVGTKETAGTIKGTQYSLFINLKNPLKTPDFVHETVSSMLSELHKQGVITREKYANLRGISNQELRELMSSLGYDGTIYENKAERGGISYSFINPNQIKSATGNIGTFAQDNSNIFYRTRNEIEQEAQQLKTKWEYAKNSNYSSVDRPSAEDFITKHKLQDVAYVDARYGRFYVRPIARYNSKWGSLEDLLNPLRREWLYDSDEAKLTRLEATQALTFNRLDADTQEALLNRGIDENLWNQLSQDEKNQAIECAGV